MVVVPLGKSTHNSEPLPRTSQDERTNWARIAAGGTLLAGGLLLLTGRRRAGLRRSARSLAAVVAIATQSGPGLLIASEARPARSLAQLRDEDNGSHG